MRLSASRFQAADLVRILTALTELEPRFRRSGQQQLLLETALVRFALIDKTVDVEALLRSLGGATEAAEPSPRASAPSPSRPAAPPPRPPVEQERPAPRREPTMEARPAQTSAQPKPAPVEAIGDRPPLDASMLTGRWDELVSRLRQGGKTLIATALEHAVPTVVTARGDVTVSLDEPNDFYARAIQSGATEIVAVLREWFSPVERVQLEGVSKQPAAPPKRLTDEDVKAQKLEALKKRDPILKAAIEMLDLEVID